jgi:hypothetical protein
VNRERDGEFGTLYKELIDDETTFFVYFRISENCFHILRLDYIILSICILHNFIKKYNPNTFTCERTTTDTNKIWLCRVEMQQEMPFV